MIAAVVTMLRLQLLRVYQSEDTVLADLLTEIAQVRGDLAIAVDRAALQLGLLDQTRQTTVIFRSLRQRLGSLGVVPAALHLHDPAQHGDCVLVFVGLNEGLPYRDALAKYAAAFFRMSRSSVTLRNSACRRLIPASAAVAAAGLLCCLIQVSRLCLRPRRQP